MPPNDPVGVVIEVVLGVVQHHTDTIISDGRHRTILLTRIERQSVGAVERPGRSVAGSVGARRRRSPGRCCRCRCRYRRARARGCHRRGCLCDLWVAVESPERTTTGRHGPVNIDSHTDHRTASRLPAYCYSLISGAYYTRCHVKAESRPNRYGGRSVGVVIEEPATTYHERVHTDAPH